MVLNCTTLMPTLCYSYWIMISKFHYIENMLSAIELKWRFSGRVVQCSLPRYSSIVPPSHVFFSKITTLTLRMLSIQNTHSQINLVICVLFCQLFLRPSAMLIVLIIYWVIQICSMHIETSFPVHTHYNL